MTAKCGETLADVPPETQFWMGETATGKCVLIFPLIDGVLRASLWGNGENGLELVAETGDPATVGKERRGAFVAAGDEPFELVKKSAKSVAAYLVKIWNRNSPVLDMGGLTHSSSVLGAFHCRHDSETPHPISGAISPADISSFRAESVNGKPRRYVVYAHQADELRVLTREETWPLTLEPLEWEIWTMTPIESRVAAVGLTNLLNGGRAISRARRDSRRGAFRFDLSSGGNFVAWCETAPTRVLGENDKVLTFTYNEASGRLDVAVPGKWPTVVGIDLPDMRGSS